MGKFNIEIAWTSFLWSKNTCLRDMFHDNQSKIQSVTYFLTVTHRNTKIHHSTSDSNLMSHGSVTVTLSEIQNRKRTGKNYDNTRGESSVCLLLWCFLYSLPRSIDWWVWYPCLNWNLKKETAVIVKSNWALNVLAWHCFSESDKKNEQATVKN